MAFRRHSVALPKDVVEEINSATSNFLSEPDIGVNMRLVDRMSGETNDAVLAEYVRQIRKVIQSKDYKRVLLALQLVEMLIMNCKTPVHRAFAHDKFLASISRVLKESGKKGTHEAVEVNDKLLDLVQSWGEAFLGHTDVGVRPFVDTYHALREKGTVFPRKQMDPDAVPVLTPTGGGAGSTITRAAPAPAASPAPATVSSKSPLEGIATTLEGIGDVSHEQVMVLKNVLTLLVGMLQAVESKEALLADETIRDMAETCKQTGPRIVELINTTMSADPARIEPLLAINDALQSTLAEHQFLCEYGPRPKPKPAAVAVAIAVPASAPAPAPPTTTAAPPATGLDDIFGAPAGSVPTASAGATPGKPPRPSTGASPAPAIPTLAPPPSDSTPKRRGRARSRSGSGTKASPPPATTSSTTQDLLDVFSSPAAPATASPAKSAAVPDPFSAGPALVASSGGVVSSPDPFGTVGQATSGPAIPAATSADPFAAIASRRAGPDPFARSAPSATASAPAAASFNPFDATPAVSRAATNVAPATNPFDTAPVAAPTSAPPAYVNPFDTTAAAAGTVPVVAGIPRQAAAPTNPEDPFSQFGTIS